MFMEYESRQQYFIELIFMSYESRTTHGKKFTKFDFMNIHKIRVDSLKNTHKTFIELTPHCLQN